ncbi:DUF6415 family natural product biosynthesis protein [Streptomyces stelliscabiei]|uniref:DUF6415 family natural product biosynthesis protein n=1 Tax=Streptomyces stelliscabiei TaxID=146820 RepID=UPI0029AD7390|nr:DUF6415 family natural product biosynthesis protein [Streptomyces stelliscabiei]MDX2554756.1 DUF6415 family natural product biosynthesis protein [Streptomyces stelliscabiei]MDX2613283.1 DUF6415 family natural product biosynthesis protein [Streptomyces stelliscabiei]MDX2638441.1 DUF6415 family natural product biosynthesis protein [Streptomyces stelliscabiei]MDX2661593.1 DUF6415 family natural product biosynthesis protein [Streptomyces stelliscabiei]MDX2712274.1 DUF6415 family natural product
MAAVTEDVAIQLLSRRASTDDETVRVLLGGLRRSLAYEAVTDELWDDLEAVLGEHARLTQFETTVIVRRFRKATTTFVEIVPHLVRPYPLDELTRLIDLSAEQPRFDAAHGHLRRFALAILALLDLMGDAAS